MNRRRRRRGEVPILKYLVYGGVGGMALWLFLSIIKQKDPSTLLKSGLATLQGDTINRYMGVEDYKFLIAQKDSIILSLNDKIDELETSAYGIAIVDVDSPTLNMRSKPSLISGIVFKIPNGAAVEVQYYDTEKLILNGKQGQWCKIKYADLEGWVWGNFLQSKN
jgi:hypothetical protein